MTSAPSATLSESARRVIADFVRLYPFEAAAEGEKHETSGLLDLLTQLPEECAGRMFERLIPSRMGRAFQEMEAGLAERIFASADPYLISIGLAQVDPEKSDALLDAAPGTVAAELREAMSFEADSAGRLMDAKANAFRGSVTAGEALASIRERSSSRIHDVFVVDDHGRLTGTIDIKDLALSDPANPLTRIQHSPEASAQTIEPRDAVVTLFEERKLSSIPVVDHENRLVGVIRHDTLIDAAQDEAMEGLQTMVGVSRDEKALSPAFFAVRKRLPWLQINLLTAFLAAAVVGMFEGTIAKVTALAVLLPVVAGQSGNTGAQALAVALRGLTVREIQVRHWPRLVRKEFAAGFLNGIAVALVTGIGVYVWSQSVGLVLVIAISMVISMAIAGVAGAAVPMVLKSLKQDPAQSSSIILTTVTDVTGFFSFLGIATLLMGMLPQGGG